MSLLLLLLLLILRSSVYSTKYCIEGNYEIERLCSRMIER